ncbi:MAG: hypothetical protein AVDCRST_MAG76-2641 [uncultured Acidimicrobiales bacterium]|uniref:LytR/CpsA/Psr regulator C-terminal domain-containing protein n=1 Tax=uncultured Acidimicrobiales bacterium TaxID=310071 RepID=A0A6J4INE3_9ACTN|nr:MAG: hypothetical protein AVDCRST_MAG76-2641 [uncultured Acidimicrobiales bacterium]
MNRTIPRPALVVPIAVTVAAALAGCRGGEDQVAVGGSTTPEASATSTTSPPPSSTLRTTTSQPATSVETSTTVRATTTTRRAPPKVVVPKQGDRVVAVFLATGTTLADPSFERARARLTSLGYKGRSGGDTACSQGAKQALPQLQDYALSVEFATRADADRFAALYGPVLGTATVTVFCVD